MTTDPTLLRRTLRARRAELDPATLRAHGRAASALVRRSGWYRKAHQIALYLPVGGEIDLHDLIESGWSDRKQLYLPVLAPFGANRLWFAPYTPDTRLAPNRFGILEPDVHPKAWHHPRQLDLVLTPLVGFDLAGRRLGMGGGYYDRSFAFRRGASRGHPRLLGAAHSVQQVEALAPQPWDVPLDGVVTEFAFHIFPHRNRP